MQLYFIRHAQSENNQLYAQTGSWEGRSEDPELTPVGQQQAEHLARFLAAPGFDRAPSYDSQNVGGFGLTHLYCSLMVRSVATAAVVARALGLPPVAWEELHEVGGIHQKGEGEEGPRGLPGRNRAYFQAHYPDLVLPPSLGPEGWWNRPFEVREARLPRARRLWQALLERHGWTEDRVAVVSHGGLYGYLMTAALELPREVWFGLNNAAITRLDVGDEGIIVQYMNRLDYLPRELVT